MCRILCVFVLTVLCVVQTSYSAKDTVAVSLEGEWGYRLDADDIGQEQQWFSQTFSKTCQLPGTLDLNQIGRPAVQSLEFKRENLLHLTRRFTYTGPAWYQRTIHIPEGWHGKLITLSLERVLWESTVWIDGHLLGTCDSLVAPHMFEVPDSIAPGEHTLTIRIDNSYKYNVSKADGKRVMAHSYTDETQTIWNGIIGDIRLQAAAKVSVNDVQVYPDLANDQVKLRIKIDNPVAKPTKGRLQISCNPALGGGTKGKCIQIPFSGETSVIEVDTEYKMPVDCQAWDEFNPSLYDLTVQCRSDVGVDAKTTRFGMREFTADGTVLRINDRPVYLRGTLECCIFPKTGHPPMDEASWLRLFTIARSYGLNHLRFHSWCPPKAAFSAADKLGFYLQVELPVWVNDIGKDTPRDDFLRQEGHRILKEYGNHPSFCMMSMGNELHGDFKFIHNLVEDFKSCDNRHLYTSTSFSFQGKHGRWPEPVDDFFVSQATVKGWIRGQGFFNERKPSTTFDFRASLDNMPVPVLSHEIGQYTVFPNFKELPKYDGPVQANNFQCIQKELKRKGLLHLADDYVSASGKWSVQLYKEDIEMAMRTPGMSGFQLLDLHDFPGQGTALIGILDAFWDSKGLIEPCEFRQFCNSTVPLARLKKRVFENNETFDATIEVIHYGPQKLNDAKAEWTITDTANNVVAKGTFAPATLIPGSRTDLGMIATGLNSVLKAQKLNLNVSIKETEYQNNWDFWVYPAKVNPIKADDVLIAEFPDKTVAQTLASGGKVLLLADPSSLREKEMGRFVPVFWSPVHFPNQINTMGLLCDSTHPALADFPTDAYTSWQWWELLTQSASVVMDQAPRDMTPIVRMIDGFTKNRRLYNLFEAQVGDGSLLFCSIDLTTDLDERIVARQLRQSLLSYMVSDEFSPKQSLEMSFVKKLFSASTAMLGAKVISVDSEQPGYEAVRAIDGDPRTLWHTQWAPQKSDYPHEIQIQLKKQLVVTGFTYLPRQDGNRNGYVQSYEIYLSKDGHDWGNPVATGTFANDMKLKKVMFENPNAVYGEKHEARYVRFVAKEGFDTNPFTAMAEFAVLEE